MDCHLYADWNGKIILLRKIIREAQALCKLENVTSWLSDDQSFEKMGGLMFHNHWKLLGLYDELPMFFLK